MPRCLLVTSQLIGFPRKFHTQTVHGAERDLPIMLEPSDNNTGVNPYRTSESLGRGHRDCVVGQVETIGSARNKLLRCENEMPQAERSVHSRAATPKKDLRLRTLACGSMVAGTAPNLASEAYGNCSAILHSALIDCWLSRRAFVSWKFASTGPSGVHVFETKLLVEMPSPLAGKHDPSDRFPLSRYPFPCYMPLEYR